MRRTPLKQKRDKPRRKAPERVPQRRRPPKRSAAEARHIARIAAMPCLVCGGCATVHHVTSDGFQRITRSHRRVVPLCPRHHQIQWGPRESVEALGHHGFKLTYGIDLLATADKLWEESSGPSYHQ